ncbi:MAG: tRNA (N6-threonylcarbamoyladenosine(37)-N6)-methyltransferase TrmO, partial [Clostridia bacterium]|nr:tRNA (N6-threonylcarbamoyladenosine(37)-N6)-methyltransferase TrmO [Clostridia bacterium]
MEIEKIGHIRTLFKTKFGLPRQSGISDNIKAQIIFEPKYRSKEALRGLESFSHVWVIWGFSENAGKEFSPTVRPPRLGGNTRVGVFATRSPFRPNSLALSCLRLEKIEFDSDKGPILHLLGADMMDGSHVYDIKPYVPHADLKPNAKGGFSDTIEEYHLQVIIPDHVSAILGKERTLCLYDALREDPRPSYIENDDRVYGFYFDIYEI